MADQWNAPWRAPRYRSWASNTVLVFIGFILLLAATIVADMLNGPEPPPTYLTGLLGVAGGALFGAAGSDKAKREADIADHARIAMSRARDVNETAIRAEYKADKGLEVAKRAHPDVVADLNIPADDGEEEA